MPAIAKKNRFIFSVAIVREIDLVRKGLAYRNTLRTRIVAGELTKLRSSFSLMVDCSNVSSRGLLEADVAIANAAAAVDVLLLYDV